MVDTTIKDREILAKAFGGNLSELELMAEDVFLGLQDEEPEVAIAAQCHLDERYNGAVRGAVITDNKDVLVYVNDKKGHEELVFLSEAPNYLCNQHYVNHSFFVWD